MAKLLKILVGLVLVVVMLVVAAVIVIPLVVDPNDYKDEIVDQVQKVTGRELVIGGDIGLSVFPWLGLELNGLELSNAPGFGDRPFAAVEHAQLRLKLIPLLSKTLEVDAVQVDGLQLSLERNRKGQTNWQDLVGAEEAEAKPSTAESSAGGPGLKSFAIGAIQISDAGVVWDDRSVGQHYEIRNLDLNSGVITPGQPVDLDLAFSVDSVQPMIKARIGFAGRLAMDEAMQNLSVAPLSLKVEDLRTETVGGRVQLDGRLAADLAAQRYRLDDLNLGLSVQGEGLPEKGLQARLLAAVAVDLVKQTLALDNLKLSSGDLLLSGDLQGTKIRTAPSFKGRLAVAEFQLRKWMKDVGLAPPETADPKVLERVALSVQLQSTPKRLTLNPLAMTLDDTHLTGEVKLQPLDKPGVRFDLAVDAIDLDRYLPPAAAEAGEAKSAAKPQPGPASGQPAPAELFPLDSLRQLDIAGVLRIGSLRASKLLAEDLELKVKAKDGRIGLSEAVKRFYDGRIEGRLAIDASGNTPTLTVDQQVEAIHAGPLLKDLTGKDSLTGLGGFNANLKAGGQTVDALKRSLGGTLDFSFSDGAVKGFNLAQMLREAEARVTGKPVPAGDQPQQTDFSELSGSARVKRGILVNNDLRAKSPFLRVEGAGKVNLVSETLDYTVTPIIVGTAKGQGGVGLKELKGVPIPVRLSGPLAKPDYSIDLKQALLTAQKTKTKELVEKKVKKKLDKVVPKDLQDKLEQGLKGLF